MLLSRISYCVVVSFFIVTQIGLMPTVVAKENNLASKAQACSQLSENKARLTCFDALVKQPATLKNKNVATLAEDSKVSAQDVDAFAKEQVKKTSKQRAEEIKSITLTISKLSKNPYGKWNISFINGQKWQQKDSYKLRLQVGQRVVLTKGALSSVYLQKENTTKRIKVKRLK